jgi:hypothetical protein
MNKLSIEQINKQCKKFEDSEVFKKESQIIDDRSNIRFKSVIVTDMNLLFMDKFRPGDPKLKNTFIYLDYEWRVLYITYAKQLIVERIGAVRDKELGPMLLSKSDSDLTEMVNLADWIFDYWNPNGLYAIEKYILDNM